MAEIPQRGTITGSMTQDDATQNPERVLRRALDRLPPPLWDQPSMAGLKERTQAALARNPIDKAECLELTRLIAISR